MEDKQIIKLYFARSESAIAETEKKYGVYCKYIARNILGNNEDAEEIVNDTYLKLWDTIPPNRPEPLKAYLGSICRNFAISRYRELHSQKRGGTASILEELSECITDGGSQNDIGESIALRDAMNRFVRSLDDKEQEIFIRRYWYASPISDIASDYSMTRSHVGVILLRTRKKLKAFLQKEGFDI